MGHYFFHLHNDIDAIDEEGQDLPSDEVALVKAEEFARDMASVSVLQGRLNLRHFMRCVAEDGRAIATVKFGDVVWIEY